MFVFLLTTFLALLLYFAFRTWNYLQYWNRQGVPNPGMIKMDWITKRFDKYLDFYAAKYGRIFGVYLGFGMSLTVNDIDIYREIATEDAHKYPIRVPFHVGQSNMTKTLFFMDADDDWKRVRSIVSPAFTSGKLKAMCEPIMDITDKLITNLEPYAESGEEFDVRNLIDAYTMDVISRCAYGIDIDSFNNPKHPVIVNAKKILNANATFSQAVCTIAPSLAKLLRFEFFNLDGIRFFEKFTNQIVDERLKNSNIQSPDLIGLMLQELEQGKSASKGITRDEITGQGIIFYLAGYDTTNATFITVLYYLTQYPQWQERIYEELLTLDGDLSYTALRELPILNGVMNEVLRLSPPVPLVVRVAKEDCEVASTGIRVPAGTQITTNPYLIHRDPGYFRDPLEFLPERFINKEPETVTNFFPFGYGTRFCVGMRFAQNELRLGIAKFVLNYRVHATPRTELDYCLGTPLLSPKNVFLRISSRK